jgi:mannose/fructose/N-acetylgalactosamine-specific phosphotransferase system component IID
MWIVAIAWMYVAIMMTLAETTHPQGTILGAIITFLFYGVAPVAIVMYILGTPGRRRARRAAEAQAEAARQASLASAAEGAAQGDASSHAASDPVTAEGKEAPRL